jgi:transposase
VFKGTRGRGIYDNMKTAVETIFVGKDHLYNRRFLQMCGHYQIDPVACTPASGWEKGQVENQVGWLASASLCRGCASRTLTNRTPGCSTNASPTPRRITIRS